MGWGTGVREGYGSNVASHRIGNLRPPAPRTPHPMSATSTVTYEGNLRTRARHLRSGAEIVTDAPVDNHGKGEAFSPTDLAATSLASCILTVVGIACERRRIDVRGMRAEVTKVMDGPPRRIGAVEIVVRMPPRDYPPEQRRVVEQAAAACPVGRSLHPHVDQRLSILWEREAPGGRP